MTKVLAVLFALVVSNGIYGGLTALIVFGLNEIFDKSYSYAIPISVVCVLVTLYVLFQAFVMAVTARATKKQFSDFDKFFDN